MNWLTKLFKKTSTSKQESTSVADVDLKLSPLEESNKHIDLGNQLFDQSRWVEAITHYLKALTLNPENHKATYNLGCSFWYLDRLQEAEGYLTKAISMHSEHYDAYWMLADIYERNQDLDRSFYYVHQLLELKPDFLPAKQKLSDLYTRIRDLGKLMNFIESEKTKFLATPHGFSMYLFYLLSEGKQSLTTLLARHKDFSAKFEDSTRFCAFSPSKFSPTKKLKIGYLAFDFVNHPVSLFMLPILEKHDRSQFTIFSYHSNEKEDFITEIVKKTSDHYRNVCNQTHEEIINIILEDDIDILVDLSGHTSGNSLPVFARKPAPIQVTYLGYVYTTGLNAIDYRLSNWDADPIEHDPLYVEKTYRFTNRLWWAYRVIGQLPKLTTTPAASNSTITFISTNSIHKLSDKCLQVWAKILASVPNSTLKIAAIARGTHRNELLETFASFGVDQSRISFIEYLPLDEFRKVTQTADIALDTFPYNGGTTTCEVLLCGVPVVSLIGNSFYSRMGYAILKDFGLDHFAVKTEEDYVKVAVALANDLNQLTTVRASMEDRIKQSSLLDEAGFTKDLEKAYQEMWQNLCAEKRPSNDFPAHL